MAEKALSGVKVLEYAHNMSRGSHAGIGVMVTVPSRPSIKENLCLVLFFIL